MHESHACRHLLAQIVDQTIHQASARDRRASIEGAAQPMRQGRFENSAAVGCDAADRIVPRRTVKPCRGVGAPATESAAVLEMPIADGHWRKPVARMMTSAELHLIATLLAELRETTLSREMFVQSENILELIRPR